MFVFTSLRDTSGVVILEALSHGVPIICFDHLGVGDIVDKTCGIKIPLTTPRKAIYNLYKALLWFAEDKSRLTKYSVGAKNRAKNYLYKTTGKKMAFLYSKYMS